MAIVKMKRLRLFGMRSDREDILRVLQHAGCVEVSETADKLEDPEWAGVSRPDGQALTAAREAGASALSALEVLKKYAPVKGGLLKSRPVISEKEFFDDGAYAAALKTAEEVNDAERRIHALYAEQSKLRGQKLTLAPWLDLDVPLDTASTKEMAVVLGTVPNTVKLEELQGGLDAATDLQELTHVSSDTEAHYLLLVFHRDAEEAVNEVLKEYAFTRAGLRGWTGTAKENDRRLDAEISALAAETEAVKEGLSKRGGEHLVLQRCADRAAQEISREEAKGRLLDTQSVFFLEGWMPAKEVKGLEECLKPYLCAWETEDPAQEEYPTVPVQLENNSLTRPMSMVTDMYSLPAYGSLDPNPLMAPFFILFYGIMMADMGYGLVMMLISALVIKKTKPKGPTVRHMFPLLGLCGVSTFIMGALTGGFFGDFLPQLAHIINPNTTFTALPALFSPLDDALVVLMGALALGVVQIFTGMGISMYKKIKRGETMDALCNEGAWYLVFLLAGGGIALGMVGPGLIASLIVLVITQSYGKKGIVGKIMGIFGSLYNGITGYFSDIMSYSRLMALMLAGAVVAQVFNQLGAITGNVVAFVIIAMIGNALNFALNILGCFVHDMRLQCLEFFGRFYEDGGVPFRPLNITTKFVDVEEK
ncbi:V-type ATP synthase subunit I [Pseudoflavonifractor sp. 524-17]|uniref:V-type ATP synthase subunit I n=1 Tax=Pseudoflavonifractor sp. 524-17 TaxID=2304577 RepID=UPI00137B1CE2|nr:V-type ATP synthase subunit I [Pseudoflavonifractor sp. 524-17]NCE65597.1 V-type ATP synthase subunit I [Pseudoflavonifractor sp. 524-17]